MVECAAATQRARDVVGMHFFNPAPVMKLVEVVHTVSTGGRRRGDGHRRVPPLGKHPVTCGDRAGFIVNALLFPYLNDAVKMLEAHYAGADDIDTAMKTGCGYPMGPFELLDVVGLDVSLAIQRQLYLEFREPGFAPAPLLEHLVTAGLPRPQGRPRVPHLRLSRAPSQPTAPRRGRPRPRSRAVGSARRQVSSDGEWFVRPVSGAAAGKAYRCPGCDQEVRAGVPHVVAWPADGPRSDDGALGERRHWHTPCWAARRRRRPGR